MRQRGVGLDGSVCDIPVEEGGFDDAFRELAAFAEAPAAALHPVSRRHLAQMRMDVCVGQLCRGPIELGLDPVEAIFGHVGKLVEDRDEIFILDHRRTGHASHPRRADLSELRPMCGRPQQLRVEHSRNPNVRSVLALAGDFFERVAAKLRLAHDTKLGVVFELGLHFEMARDLLAPGERPVGDPIRLVPRLENHPLPHHEPRHRNVERFGAKLEQHRPRLGRGSA